MAAPVVLTDANFDLEVLKASAPVLVDFYADWCGPCRMMAPIVEKIAGEYAGKVKVCKLDVTANPQTSSRYNVMSIPTLIVFKDGKAADKQVGAGPKEMIAAMLDKIIGKPAK